MQAQSLHSTAGHIFGLAKEVQLNVFGRHSCTAEPGVLLTVQAGAVFPLYAVQRYSIYPNISGVSLPEAPSITAVVQAYRWPLGCTARAQQETTEHAISERRTPLYSIRVSSAAMSAFAFTATRPGDQCSGTPLLGQPLS